jgi:hypothetical protein
VHSLVSTNAPNAGQVRALGELLIEGSHLCKIGFSFKIEDICKVEESGLKVGRYPRLVCLTYSKGFKTVPSVPLVSSMIYNSAIFKKLGSESDKVLKNGTSEPVLATILESMKPPLYWFSSPLSQARLLFSPKHNWIQRHRIP